jgi:hypothetical protein
MLLALQLHFPLSLHKRDTLSLCTRERREHIARTPHRNRESRPPKPALIASSSAWLKTGNQVLGKHLHATAHSFVLLLTTSRRLGVIGTATLLLNKLGFIGNNWIATNITMNQLPVHDPDPGLNMSNHVPQIH